LTHTVHVDSCTVLAVLLDLPQNWLRFFVVVSLVFSLFPRFPVLNVGSHHSAVICDSKSLQMRLFIAQQSQKVLES